MKKKHHDALQQELFEGFALGRIIEWSKTTFPDNESNREASEDGRNWNANESACIFYLRAKGRLFWSRCRMQLAG